MLNPLEAISILKKAIPDASVQNYIEYENLYIIQAFRDDPLEGQLDPFYSVDKNTGEFSDFALFNDPNVDVIVGLFVNSMTGK